MSKLGKELWVEKYRPTTIKDTLMPAEFKKFFTNIVESGEVPNLLLESASPGSGKCLHYDEKIRVAFGSVEQHPICIKIGYLFELLDLDNDKYYEEQTCDEQVYIESPSGYIPIRAYVKKPQIKTVRATIGNTTITGADKHKVKVDGEWKYLEDFSHEVVGYHDLYDISVDAPHEYYTANGIINHNTSSSKALANDLGADFKFIKASQDNGINVLRDQIDQFAKVKSIFGKSGLKLVLLDEADYLSPAMQAGLRSAIEEYSKNCRFILTCNFKHKIIEPLRSRLQQFNYNMSSKEHKDEMVPKIKKRLTGILTHEKIPFVDSVLDILIETKYPDIRTIYNTCHQFANMNGCVDERIINFQSHDKEIINLIAQGDIRNARQFIIENGYDYDGLYKFLFDNFNDVVKDPSNKATAILTINRYMVDSSFSVDKEITFTACMIELSGLV